LPARERSLVERLILPDALAPSPAAYATIPSHSNLPLPVHSEANVSRLSRFSKTLGIAVGTLEAQAEA
jgi:hypothetical protein